MKNYGDKAKTCGLTKTLPFPIKGCEEDCWDFEACLEKRRLITKEDEEK